MSIECYENDYISNLLKINKSLRDQIEILYSLLRKKTKIDGGGQISNRIDALISELEIVHSNLSIEMKEQDNLIEVIKNVDKKFKAIQENNELMNQMKINFDKMTNDNINLVKDNGILKQQIQNILSQMELMKSENIKLVQENGILNIEISKRKENETINKEMINKIEMLSNNLTNVETKYKKKLSQKDLIINKIDEQLQKYEEEIRLKNIKLAQYEKVLNEPDEDEEEEKNDTIDNNEINDTSIHKKSI